MDHIDGIDIWVTDEMRGLLSKPFTKDDVLCALSSMHPGKSPGPDGLPVLFYNKF